MMAISERYDFWLMLMVEAGGDAASSHMGFTIIYGALKGILTLT